MKDLLTNIDLFFDQYIEHPTLLSFIFGVVFVAYIVRPIVWFHRRQKSYEDFSIRHTEFGPTRSDFFEHFGKAYIRAKRLYNVPNLPDKYNDFLITLQYPGWLDGRVKNLGPIARVQIDREASEAWAFFETLYEEIEDVRAGMGDHRLLLKNEHNLFHKERQSLVDFWDNVSRDYLNRKLPKKRILKDIEDQWILIKILSYLSVALYLKNKQTGPGAQYLYRFSHGHFYKWWRVKRSWEWIRGKVRRLYRICCGQRQISKP